MMSLGTVFGYNLIRHIDKENSQLFLCTADLGQNLVYMLLNFYPQVSIHICFFVAVFLLRTHIALFSLMDFIHLAVVYPIIWSHYMTRNVLYTSYLSSAMFQSS